MGHPEGVGVPPEPGDANHTDGELARPRDNVTNVLTARLMVVPAVQVSQWL